MRLLHVRTLEFTEFHHDVPPYAIASHRWKAGAEVGIKNIRHKRNVETYGHRKVDGFAQHIQKNIPDIEWLWIDTCCVNQNSSQEVTEAVNSMFRWYAQAELCLAYLADVNHPGDLAELRHSEWFRRGWTLQELLAPSSVVFLSADWKVIGHKGQDDWEKNEHASSSQGPALNSIVAEITGIPVPVLNDYAKSKTYSVEERLAWLKGRETTRVEDMSYSVFGIFNVNMAVIYGEGAASARRRLREEIAKRAHDSHSDPASQGAPVSTDAMYTFQNLPPRSGDTAIAHTTVNVASAIASLLNTSAQLNSSLKALCLQPSVPLLVRQINDEIVEFRQVSNQLSSILLNNSIDRDQGQASAIKAGHVVQCLTDAILIISQLEYAAISFSAFSTFDSSEAKSWWIEQGPSLAALRVRLRQTSELMGSQVKILQRTGGSTEEDDKSRYLKLLRDHQTPDMVARLEAVEAQLQEMRSVTTGKDTESLVEPTYVSELEQSIDVAKAQQWLNSTTATMNAITLKDFEHSLMESWVYRRNEHREENLSFTTSSATGPSSLLEQISLADLSLVSAIKLPVCMSEVSASLRPDHETNSKHHHNDDDDDRVLFDDELLDLLIDFRYRSHMRGFGQHAPKPIRYKFGFDTRTSPTIATRYLPNLSSAVRQFLDAGGWSIDEEFVPLQRIRVGEVPLALDSSTLTRWDEWTRLVKLRTGS